jgi:hypothetical protein
MILFSSRGGEMRGLCAAPRGEKKTRKKRRRRRRRKTD